MKHKFTVDRRTWLRGRPGRGLLLNPDNGRKCILGFGVQQLCGFTDGQIAFVESPDHISDDEDAEAKLKTIGFVMERVHGTDCTPRINEVMEVNDSPDYTEEGREQRLKEIFAGLDIEVEFIN